MTTLKPNSPEADPLMSMTSPSSSLFGHGLKFEANPDVLAQAMGDDIVLVHLHTNAIFELNTTASRFWVLLGEGHTLDTLCDTMLSEFDITRLQLEAEIASLVEMLQNHNLISVKES